MPSDKPKRDSYEGMRNARGLPSPGLYEGKRADADGVKYEPSFRGAAAYAASNAAANNAARSQPADGSNARDTGVPARNTRADEIAGALAGVLEQEALLYRDAADISSKKTDIIVHGKIEELDSLVKAEQAIILKIGRLENEREKIVLALSEELDMDLEGVTLSDINAHLSNGSYTRLSECQKSLAQTLGGLKNSNDMNSQLIQNALDYVNFSVNLLTTNQDSGNTYSQDGGEDAAGKQRRNIFDVRL